MRYAFPLENLGNFSLYEGKYLALCTKLEQISSSFSPEVDFCLVPLN